MGLDKDEREEFLKRENDLSDQLAEKERVLNAAEKLVSELKEELSFLKDQESSLSNVRPFNLGLFYTALIVTTFSSSRRRTSRCLVNSMSSACKWNA